MVRIYRSAILKVDTKVKKNFCNTTDTGNRIDWKQNVLGFIPVCSASFFLLSDLFIR